MLSGLDDSNTCYLLTLPSEILKRIIHLSSVIVEREDEDYQFLSWSYPEHSYIHLKSIALCCRRLYILCAPFLWKDKEFILPREDDEKSDNDVIQMATDILSKKALFQNDYYLGEYVRSLSRDLTNGPHFDLANSKLMAQLVCNLRALRIDFHPIDRTEHYGLRFFLQFCPQLAELYLNQCRDTFDDFLTIVEFKPRLISLTLTNCTIKSATLEKIAEILEPTLQHLLLKQVLIEPKQRTKSNSHLMSTMSLPDIHPFHFQDTQVSVISRPLLCQLLSNNKRLTQLALTTDSISTDLLRQVCQHSPFLQKLAIMIHDLDPFNIQQLLVQICKLKYLSTLSLNFKKCYPVTKENSKLPCHVPASAWNYFAHNLPPLKLLHISATRIIVDSDFIPALLRPNLRHIMIHSLVLVTRMKRYNLKNIETQNEDQVIQSYLKDRDSMTDQIDAWDSRYRQHLFTYEQAKIHGFDYFDEDTDKICFIKGFSSSVSF